MHNTTSSFIPAEELFIEYFLLKRKFTFVGPITVVQPGINTMVTTGVHGP